MACGGNCNCGDNCSCGSGNGGSAGAEPHGSQHWLLQRATAVILVPLMVYMMCGVLGLASGGYAEAAAWFKSPLNALIAALSVGALFYHATLGLQVVLEDYIHSAGKRYLAIITAKFICFVVGGAGIFAILSIYFRG